MADAGISLIPVRISELAVGKPVPRPVYDWYGNLLLASGRVIESQSQLDGLASNGFIYDPKWDLSADERKAPTVPIPSRKPNSPPEAVVEEASAGSKETIVAMDDVRWYVGETLYLQLLDNPAIRYTVRLIGFVKNKTVLVTAPSIDGKFEFIREGQTFVARAFSGKKAFAFMSAAVKSVHSPHPYLHLSYPREVRCAIVRRGARAQIKIIASVSLGEPERVGAATLTDMSIGGTSGTMKQVFGEKGEEGLVKFKVHAAGQDEYLSLKMTLRSVTPSENGDGFRHGFEFQDLSVHDRLILSAFVHQTLAEGF